MGKVQSKDKAAVDTPDRGKAKVEVEEVFVQKIAYKVSCDWLEDNADL